MKSEFRRELAQQPFEEKIRRVSELIWLTPKIKAQRANKDAETIRFQHSEIV